MTGGTDDSTAKDGDGAGVGARPDAPQRVFQRRVLYVPGYDPFPPRRYRELYRRESAQQAAVSGYALQVTGHPGCGDNGWTVTARIPEPDLAPQHPEGMARCAVTVLVWSDIVRVSMRHGILATYGQLFRTAWVYLGSGALFRLMRLRKGPILAALYPVAVLLLQAACAVALGALVAQLLRPGLGAFLAVLSAAGVAWGVLAGFRRLDHRIYAHYLMHDYAFAAGDRGAYPAPLEGFITRAARRIVGALAEPVDEVLVIGHSSGAHLAVSAVAEALRIRGQAGGPALALLTLGQSIPMLSFLPRAERLRADLHDLAADDRLFWLDVSAPGDGCSFALCDPVAVSGVAPAVKRGPLVVSAAFRHTLSPTRWQALRRRYLRLHFQYLCAFDRPGDYDYFRITAGPVTLARRYDGRRPSPRRIETPQGRYRSRTVPVTR